MSAGYLVIAGTHSGVGKTTVATGLMAALRRRGLRVASAKVGPDFIDPGYHSLATGRPGRNLDAWLCGESAIPALAARAAAGADLLIVEGVMGLFDGAGEGDGTFASTAHVARLLGAPVVLVVDASAMSTSVAALVHGYASYDPSVRVAGVILNRVGSDGHEELLRNALAPLGLPVFGALRRDDALVWRDRHLGLVPVVEERAAIESALHRLASIVAERCDLDAILQHTVLSDFPSPARGDRTKRRRCRVAVASGPAFSFMYPDNVELLEEAGAEIVPFDPAVDRALPAGVDALIAGGGFPEIYAEELSANEPLLADVRARVNAGLPTWAECGGLLWLSRSLDGHPLCGAIDADAHMTDRLTLGYRRVRFERDTPLGPAGTEMRGHEFHYSTIEPAGDALSLEGRFGQGRAGFGSPTMLASYVHVHLAGDSSLADQFVSTAARLSSERR